MDRKGGQGLSVPPAPVKKRAGSFIAKANYERNVIIGYTQTYNLSCRKGEQLP